MKNGVFWDVTPSGSCKNRRFEELSASFIRVRRIGELGTTLAVVTHRRTVRRNTKCVCRWLITASVVLISPILVTLMKEALSSSETSVLATVTLCKVQKDISN
jgi:hypothetical protein